MVDKLSLYQGAALALGERKPSSLTENSVMRRRLDTAWDSGVVRGCLQRGLWNHAMRTVRSDYSPSVEPDFGYRRAFDKPTDWVRTAIVASDEYCRCALNEYADEATYLFADIDILYWRFVSDDAQYGMNFAGWPQNFTDFVEHSLAWKATKSTTGSENDAEAMEAKVKRFLKLSRSTDAMDEPTQFTRSGWAESRRGRSRENG